MALREHKVFDKNLGKFIDSKLDYYCIDRDVIVHVKYKAVRSGVYSPVSCRQLTNPESNGLVFAKFTGMKDVKKQDIVDGHILKIEGEGESAHSGRANPYYVVEWRGVGWVASGYNGQSKVHPPLNFKLRWEIVGYIHLNPELLKKKSDERKFIRPWDDH